MRLVILMILLLTACSENHQPSGSKQSIQQLHLQAIKPLAAAPELHPFIIVAYQISVGRNPFQMPSFQSASGKAPDMAREKTALERFAISDLRMVGILASKHKRWALIKAPDGRLYKLAVGEYIGQDYGKVIGVDDNKLRIEQSVIDDNHWQQHQVVLHLVNPGDKP